MPIVLLFLAVAGIALVDIIFRYSWPGRYFHVGIPLVQRTMPLSNRWFSITARQLNQKEWPSTSTDRVFTVYEIATGYHGLMLANRWVEQRQGRYKVGIPLCHAFIKADEVRQRIILSVQLKFTTLLLLLLLVWIAVSSQHYIGLLWLIGFCTITVLLCYQEISVYIQFWEIIEKMLAHKSVTTLGVHRDSYVP